MNQGTKDTPSNTMAIIVLNAKKVVSTIETGMGAHGVLTSADNQFAYVISMYEDTLSVIYLRQDRLYKPLKSANSFEWDFHYELSIKTKDSN